jgi:2-dehydropantoate 2-reductase
MALAGEDVTLIDIGPHLDAIKTNGLRVIMASGEEAVVRDVAATDDVREVGVQDVVILALKAYDIEKVAKDIPALFDEDTFLIHLQNGLPWWYFQRHGGPHDGRRIDALDPTGVISESIDPNRIVGCVVFPASEIAEPGVIRHIEGNRFPVGELDGRHTDRAEVSSRLFNAAGFKSFVIEDIRPEIWLKLWGNMSLNPVSALTHATMVEICQFPPTRQLLVDLMTEAQDIAHEFGIQFRVPLEKRIAGAEKVGAHKTSTLQDVEAGRRLELEAQLGALIELGQLVGVKTPNISAIYACTKLLDRTMESHGVGVKPYDVIG